MELGDVENYEDLVNFFMGRGFEGYNEEFREFNVSKLYKIRLKEIDRSPESVAELSRYRTELKGIGQNVTHYLLYTSDFSKFVFMRQLGDPFRFTYDKDKIKKLPTETRLSLLKKLGGLKYKDEVFNETIENLFDVKEIVNTFFKEYKDIVKKLSGGITIKDVNPELYAQVLMDRIIFLYFLQTKGVLDEKYLSDHYHGRDKGVDYYRDFLRPLFFEILNNEKHDKDKDIVIRGINFGRLPYLNGGLFRRKDFERGDIEVDDSVWGEVFGLLNRYEWVVEEQKGDSTVLTPAILGHIYEKSVIAATQKETGSYYTPQEITNYISMNTIYPYLTDRVNEKFRANYRNISRELLNKKNHSKKEIEVIRFLYFDALKNLTVLDNACGSGAFLVAALYVLIPLYRKCINILMEKDRENFKKELEDISNHKNPNYYIKRTIITNNLYGVDIQEGAVEIAKLRLWLSMVSDVDKDNVEPLPNIDYNIMCGNSLMGFVEAPDDEQFALSSWVLEEIKPEQRTLVEQKNHQTRIKSETVKEIMRAKGMLVRDYKKTQGSEHAEKLRREIENINKRFRPSLNEKLLRELQDKKIKITEDELKKLNPFHWGFEFYDVFERGGFDVVIGNPPYGDILKDTEKKITSINYDSSNSEIAGLFVERSINTLKKLGCFSYIITFAITFNKSLSKTRHLIYKHFNHCKILNFDRDKCRIFVGMSQSVSIMLCYQKGENLNACFYTSRLFRDMPAFNCIELTKANSYILGDGNVSFDKPHRLPKIGEKINKDIIKKLIENQEHLSGYMEKGGKLWIRTSGNYWYNAFDRKPYENSKIKSILINDKYLPFTLILMNSSLYYFWFRVFGDGRDMNSDIYKAFPLPKKEIIEGHNILFKKVSNKFMNDLFSVFDNGKKRFLTSEIKESIDMIDLILGKMYGLSYNEIDHIMNYDHEVRTGRKMNQPYSTLIDYMLFLNKTEELRKSEKELIRFIDRQIIDSLIYELYFKEELKTNLLELVEPYLKETDNLDEIRGIVDKIKLDKEIIETIDKIKNHEWVKVIEGG